MLASDVLWKSKVVWKDRSVNGPDGSGNASLLAPARHMRPQVQHSYRRRSLGVENLDLSTLVESGGQHPPKTTRRTKNKTDRGIERPLRGSPPFAFRSLHKGLARSPSSPYTEQLHRESGTLEALLSRVLVSVLTSHSIACHSSCCAPNRRQ